MALDEEPATLRELHHASDCLRACPAFAGVDGEALEALAAQAVQFCLPAGAVLFEAGSTPDGCFVIASGRLGIKPDDSTQWTALLGRGEVIGEIGWLLQEPRSAGAVALARPEAGGLVKGGLPAARQGCPKGSLAVWAVIRAIEHR